MNEGAADVKNVWALVNGKLQDVANRRAGNEFS